MIEACALDSGQVGGQLNIDPKGSPCWGEWLLRVGFPLVLTAKDEKDTYKRGFCGLSHHGFYLESP